MINWKKYNQESFVFTNKLLEFNRRNNFNFYESGIYNHVRDLLAITLASFENYKEINILDFGSNTSTWANLKNKIDVRNLDVTIYDPFSESDYSKTLSFGFNVKVISNLNLLKGRKFDLTIFGSSSQYMPDFIENFLELDCLLSGKLLFTDTAFSKKESFIAEQNNSFRGNQFIRSYDLLRTNLESKSYKEIFKSTLPINDEVFYPSKYTSEVIVLNILFSKINFFKA